MLRRDLAVTVILEAGPYGVFQVLHDNHVVLDGGKLAFAGILPSLAAIRARVRELLPSNT